MSEKNINRFTRFLRSNQELAVGIGVTGAIGGFALTCFGTITAVNGVPPVEGLIETGLGFSLLAVSGYSIFEGKDAIIFFDDPPRNDLENLGRQEAQIIQMPQQLDQPPPGA